MIISGDCLEVMKTFPDNHFLSIVTDPPYGIHFMGKDWDSYAKGKCKIGRMVPGMDSNSEAHEAGRYDARKNDQFQDFIYQFGLEALRIVKPGGHILMFGAPRRYHRQVSGLEDAGWEIRDCLMWIFASGFPKSHNHFGIEGFGTSLKPAYEPIIMAMRPLEGTFKQNAEKWGQAGINIDGCRISTGDKLTGSGSPPLRFYGENSRPFHENAQSLGCKQHAKGRWPANVMFDEEAAAMLDEQSGESKSNPSPRPKGKSIHCYGKFNVFKSNASHLNDSGGASRFFYCAKTSSRERNEGLEGMSLKEKPLMGEFKENPGRITPKSSPTAKANYHPTVKPLKLMEYLIKLVMPPSHGLLLDPFAGSGSTILAAKRLGFDAIGIEKQPEYAEIARKRVESYEKKQTKSEEQLDLLQNIS